MSVIVSEIIGKRDYLVTFADDFSYYNAHVVYEQSPLT